MNPHPTPEEWMSFLYEEDSQADHRLRTEHLRQCAECRQEVERWHHSMQALDDWQLPAAAVPASAASLATACSTPEPVPARGQGRGAGRGVGRGAVPSLDGGFSFPPRMLAAAAAVALLATGASFGYFLPARHPDAAGLAAATKA